MKLSEINLSDIDLKEAGEWPLIGKAVLVVLVMAAVLGAGYYFFTNEQLENLDKVVREEQQLRQEFIEKQRVTANLDAFRNQLKQLEADLEVMLRQLPTGTEMPDLLEDVSDTGKKNGLEFELFKPEAEQPREFYAAKPITIRAKATYHQFGAFVSSVAALSRIVTLEKAALTGVGGPKGSAKPGKGSNPNELLNIQATLQTYRYMDEAAAPTGRPAGKSAAAQPKGAGK